MEAKKRTVILIIPFFQGSSSEVQKGQVTHQAHSDSQILPTKPYDYFPIWALPVHNETIVQGKPQRQNMARVAFLLILVRVSLIRKSLCDSRIVGVFERMSQEGKGGAILQIAWYLIPNLLARDALTPSGKVKGKETLPWIPCRHICNRTGFQSALPARLWQAPQSPPSVTESAALGEERPVRACTPTHMCTADSQQDPWKTTTCSYLLIYWKKKQNSKDVI